MPCNENLVLSAGKCYWRGSSVFMTGCKQVESLDESLDESLGSVISVPR